MGRRVRQRACASGDRLASPVVSLPLDDAPEDPVARYGKKAQQKVERAMRERRKGTLKSGRSGKKVTSRKQAIAIGLSEARRAGGKVPPQPKRP